MASHCDYCGNDVKSPCGDIHAVHRCPTFISPPPANPGLSFSETLEELELIKEGDIVSAPSHYTKWAIQPITFIMRNGFEFWRGNIVKYAARAGYKLYDGMDAVQSEITDLKKVIRYAEMRINLLNGEKEL